MPNLLVAVITQSENHRRRSRAGRAPMPMQEQAQSAPDPPEMAIFKNSQLKTGTAIAINGYSIRRFVFDGCFVFNSGPRHDRRNIAA
ncbi:MAG: hypothetical protein IID44_23900 [Planctomycetes bacterium]|nr:hypothetical protein [Planctomycetota bacterium]